MDGKILIIDDEARLCTVLKAGLEQSQLSVTTANSGESALQAFEIDPFDIVVTDIKMPGLSGLDVLETVKNRYPDTEVLLMTAYADAQTAVEAMKAGAYDYLIKPFDIQELRQKINHILDKRKLSTENRDLRQRLQAQASADAMVGLESSLRDVFDLIQKVAQRDATVLIRGESGTGKELVARSIHRLSRIPEAPFVAVNCSALPEALLENELFGHEKGAFTGADDEKPGRFEWAGDGTVFLDEIGDISPTTQVKLLRVLQQKEITRLGGVKTIPIQARCIAATNRDLEEAVKAGDFRQDLYYRINVFPIHLPPLRERCQDIPDLVAHFMKQQKVDPSRIDSSARDLLQAYHWPGNVRELENIVERALILSGYQGVRVEDLPAHIRGEQSAPFESDTPVTLKEMEIRMIRQALKKHKGNKSMAARQLGITRRQLYSRIERLGIPV
jgi:DNA-binding NtrC family response regulator